MLWIDKRYLVCIFAMEFNWISIMKLRKVAGGTQIKVAKRGSKHINNQTEQPMESKRIVPIKCRNEERFHMQSGLLSAANLPFLPTFQNIHAPEIQYLKDPISKFSSKSSL